MARMDAAALRQCVCTGAAKRSLRVRVRDRPLGARGRQGRTFTKTGARLIRPERRFARRHPEGTPIRPLSRWQTFWQVTQADPLVRRHRAGARERPRIVFAEGARCIPRGWLASAMLTARLKASRWPSRLDGVLQRALQGGRALPVARGPGRGGRLWRGPPRLRGPRTLHPEGPTRRARSGAFVRAGAPRLRGRRDRRWLGPDWAHSCRGTRCSWGFSEDSFPRRFPVRLPRV